MIVLITFAVVAYFSKATTNRRIESASGSAVRADILARTASEIVLSDLRSEIIGGSSINQPTTRQMPIYTPSDPQKMTPSRVLADPAMLTNLIYDNLAKQSVGRFFPASYTVNPLITSTTRRNTSIISANNRNVSAARWNYPVLNTGIGFDPDPSKATQLPQWILLNRNGVEPTQTWDNAFKDYTPANANAIIGRFAFNVYDVGGLLDSSVAGLPVFTTPLTGAQVQQLKSTQTGASLYDRVTSTAILPGFDATKQTAFVNTWRFKSTDTSSGNSLLDFMTSPTLTTFADSGFMTPTTRSGLSNSMAFSRQDLLRATISTPVYLPVASLPYFTHFSRELNAPSWTPVTPAGSTIDYAAQAEQPTATNRDIPNVRVTSVFTRADGTQTVVGEPLIKNRFPLRRLDGIGSDGVNASGFRVMLGGSPTAPTASTVQRDLGLVWDNANTRWVYNSPHPTRYNPPTSTTVDPAGSGGGNYDPVTGNGTPANAVKNLAQVAAEGREPDFFELLKACILSGSVGLGSDATGTGRTFVDAEARFYQQPLSNDSQIIQIGANIIDQWDADKNPTFIFFASNEYAGVENLPYLNKVGFQPRWQTSPSVLFRAWVVPSFWIPTQNGTTVGPASATNPTVRFIMTSGAISAAVANSTSTVNSATVTADPSNALSQPYGVFATSRTFATDPNFLAYGNGTTPARQLMIGAPNNSSGSALGIETVFTSTPGITQANTVRAYPVFNNATFEMQAQIGVGGPWKTYQKWSGCTANVSSGTAVCEPASGFDWTQSNIYDPEFILLDPRTMRFGVWESDAKGSGVADYTRGVLDTLDRSGLGFQSIISLGPQGSTFTGVGAEMANNIVASPGYVDWDGIRRRGDFLSGGATSAMLPTNVNDRPPTLSRRIRTVAELGTVFRGQPWKTLNFTTADSGDAGLLDALTIFESNSIFRSDIIAGKLSLNTRQPLVIEAVLAGIATNTLNSTPLISATQRSDIANALVAMTTAQPMINKSELVTRLAADPSVTSLGNKEAREAVIRALSDVGQTRTWNLMIDVIAQAGKYGADAATVDGFIVEGERRYWLHVAIDRFTGEVIDQQLEAVYE